MKKMYAFLFFLLFHYFCNAQPPEGNNDRVEVVKMAYMARELNLSPEEAQNFWPVYNNYQNEIKQARNQYPDDEVGFEKKVVEIKQRYQGNFKRVLGGNNQRINKVYTTDRQFTNTLRNELKNRQQNKQNNGQKQEPKRLQQQPPLRNNENPNRNKNNTPKKGNGNNRRPRSPS